MFISNKPSTQYLHKYYSKQFSYIDGKLNEQYIRNRSQRLILDLKTQYPQAKTLCDVGSGYGYFLREAEKKGVRCVGIEPSKQLATISRKISQSTIFNTSLENFVKQQKQFDIVTCIHTIEHVPNLKQFLRLLSKLVRKSGILYIETPNVDSHLFHTEQKKYTFLLAPEHLWILSRHSFYKIIPPTLSLARISTYTESVHVMGILKSLLHKDKKITKKTKQEKQDYVPMVLQTKKKKAITQYLFDDFLAPLVTSLFNLYHKGSILELYFNKKQLNC